jgi:AGZA family xanthine/uracil permease-like MFS transporter
MPGLCHPALVAGSCTLRPAACPRDVEECKQNDSHFSFRQNDLHPIQKQAAMLNRFFRLDALNTTIKTECFAGFTTFLTIAYILFVNPAILGDAGMDKGAVFTVTAITVVIGTFLCGMFSNLPIAIAPALGLNTFFAFIVVQKMGFTWQEGLGAVFLSGFIFILLTILQIRQWVINAIPKTLHMAIAAGIGAFLLVVGLKSLNIVIFNGPGNFSLGKVMTPQAGLGFLGFCLMLVFDRLKVRGSILFSIVIVTLISIVLGLSQFEGIFNPPPSISPTFLQMKFTMLTSWDGLLVIFTFLLIILFDSTGTLIGLLHQTKFNEQLHKQSLTKALLADGTATVVGAALGTSTTTPYIESAAGIAAGGRSGLTACVISFLFLLTLFFAPLAEAVPDFACAPALLYVACKMLTNMIFINWKDATEYLPSILTVLMIPFLFSIANGIAIGFLFFIALKLMTGQWKKIQKGAWILSLIFLVFLILTKGN